jgi:proteasome lid subunit RPN8/RPN11
MYPHQQLAAFKLIDLNGWELAAIYHSHPLGPDQPSPTDIAEAHYPDTITLIWSKQPGDWHCHAFRILEGHIDEIEIQLLDDK